MLKKIFQSSTGEGLAKRWESFFSSIIPAIVAISAFIPSVNLTEAGLNELNGQIIVIISSAVAIWKAIEFANGWIRRNFFKKHGMGKFARQ